MRRWCSQLAVLASLVVVALAGSTGAGAGPGNGNGWGQNVDPELVQAVTADSSSSNGTARYHVLVFGAGLGDPKSAPSGIRWRNDLDVVGGSSATLTGDQVAQLAAQQGVQYITVDEPVGPAGGTSTAGPSASALATLYPQIDGATGLWAGGSTGSGVGIAIIDSGVTPRQDFGSRLVQVQLPAQDGTQSVDTVGHGSAVAGVAAGSSPDGKYVGVAPGATVYAINVARGDGVYTSDVIAGLGWVLQNAKQNNIGVVNLSLTQVQPSSYLTNALDAAVEQLWKQGIVVVVSAGNSAPTRRHSHPRTIRW